MTNNPFIELITSVDSTIRNQSFRKVCQGKSLSALMEALTELEQFRRQTDSLYHRVRACLFLYTAYRFVLPDFRHMQKTGKTPYSGFEHLLNRRFEEAIAVFLQSQKTQGVNGTICSALAEAYHQRAFQILGEQVRKSVRSTAGNQWMFRGGYTAQHPIKIHPQLLQRGENEALYPILEEKTAVRMDLSHSGWSDIFFLGMDYPEGARVINVSVNLGVFGRDETIQPPIQSYVRVIAEPVLRLTSVDLEVTKDVTTLDDLFNFGNDYLSLLKAGIIASGCIPPSFEGTQQALAELLGQIVAPRMGLELVTMVNDIPKGSRFAVSTNLLGSIIAVLMRATKQTKNLSGQLLESERRLVAARAILGEWLGGSGGGWQDSGGVWPGIKAIEGALAQSGDPEYNISRGCLLPQHRILQGEAVHPQMAERLTDSLVLMHGGMAQNVGPVLEMVTEKYLLRDEAEWTARLATNEVYDGILQALKMGDVKALAKWTAYNFDYPIKTIIPWATNHYTETLIRKAKQQFKEKYLGFMMLGGMSGGGMGMYIDNHDMPATKAAVLEIIRATKAELVSALPFAMEPVVYNFEINNRGTFATMLRGKTAWMPDKYYGIQISNLARIAAETINYQRKLEVELYTAQLTGSNASHALLRTLVSNLFQVNQSDFGDQKKQQNELAAAIKEENGFDHLQHEKIKDDLQKGRIGLSRNRLPAETTIEDVSNEEVTILENITSKDESNTLGMNALKSGKVAVLSLAGGVGSRWTKGAGVIKAIFPFTQIGEIHRSFLEVHLAKTAQTGKNFGANPPHLIATSYLTYDAIAQQLTTTNNYGYEGSVYVSKGKSIGQRLVPMVRDLRFLWEEMPQEKLDENKEKVRAAGRAALMGWAKDKGEGSDYVDNLAKQRFSPLGHWYELPNLLRNGVLAELLQKHPEVETILLHNIDTLGANLDPSALSQHLASGNMLTFEVVPRRLEDSGGGLAKVNGQVRLLEGLAQPHEEDELKLSYYNSMTTWIQIDDLLAWFGLKRADLTQSPAALDEAVRKAAQRMPSYVTIKEVKYRWGHGQEDVYPVAQIEKLWSDMTALPDVACGFLVVDRKRGQQLKDPAQLDAWVNDGSKDYVAKLMGEGQ
ncbi:MAG: UTP--glucose-1-phosphate uridylyltransferase [Bacteroidota bacterium]